MTTQLSLKVPAELRQSLEADAQMLGISVSAAARLRLRTGRVPSVNETKPHEEAGKLTRKAFRA